MATPRAKRRGERRRQQRAAATPAVISPPPGTARYTGEPVDRPVRITAFDYDADSFTELDTTDPAACGAFRDSAEPTWVCVDGIHDPAAVTAVGQAFGLHPLVIEDLVNVNQRPKVEDYGDYLFCTLKLVSLEPETLEIRLEQISLVLGDRWVLTFQEGEAGLFAPVRDALRQDRGQLRRLGPDYLAYRLIDAVVDNYFQVLEGLGERVEDLEDEIMQTAQQATLGEIHQTKRSLITFRRALWPMREVVGELQRGTTALVRDETRVYYRDVYDHVIEAMEVLEMDLSTVGGLHDLYLNRLSHRMNEVMKTLTVIATIILPMGLVPAIYGQNLKIPETEWRYGYLLSYLLMALVGGGMLVWLRRRDLV